jgi:hypothetical protein
MFDDVVDLIKVFFALIVGYFILSAIATTLYHSSGFGYLIVGLFIVFGFAVILAGIKKIID